MPSTVIASDKRITKSKDKSIPSHLTCQITGTGELMEDPVLTERTGQTYERASIEKWLRSNNKDPLTNIVLTSKKLTPNYAIKTAIEEYKKKHGLMQTNMVKKI